jgi:hypothetical protein
LKFWTARTSLAHFKALPPVVRLFRAVEFAVSIKG